MYYKLILAALMLFSVEIQAQSKFSGVVLLENGGAAKGASIAMFNSNDSSLYASTISLADGRFSLNVAKDGSYFVEVSYVGYKKVRVPVINLPEAVKTITLQSSNVLNEVTIKAKKPTYRYSKGSLVVDVGRSSLAAMPDISSVMNFIPGVVYSDNGVKILGSGTPLILLNGKEISSFTEIELLQPSAIWSITVDRTPTAKYSSKYKSIIHITTKPITNSSLTEYNNLSIGRKYKGNVGFQKNILVGKFSSAIDFRLNNRKTIDYSNVSERTTYANTASTNYYNDTIKNKVSGIDVGWGTSYRMSSKSNLQLQYSYYYSVNKPIYSSNVLLENGKPFQIVQSNIRKAGDYGESNNHASISYSYTSDSTFKVAASTDYLFKHVTDFSSIAEIKLGDRSFDEINFASNYNVFLSSIDVVKAKCGFDFNFGAEYNNIDNSSRSLANSQAYQTFNANTKIADKTFGVYLSVSKKIGKGFVEVAFRYDNIYKWCIKGNDPIRYSNSMVIPSVRYNLMLNSNAEILLSYARKTVLPNFADINPLPVYYNSNAYSIGNPNLRHTMLDRMNAGISLFNNFSFGLEYCIFSDKILRDIPMLDSLNRLKYTTINIARAATYGVNAEYNRNFLKYSFFIGANMAMLGSYSKSDLISNKSNRWSYSIAIKQSLNLHKFVKAYANFVYSSAEHDITTINSRTILLTSGINVNLCRAKYQFGFAFNDILRKSRSDWTTSFRGIDVSQMNSYDTRNIQLFLRFKFDTFRANIGDNEKYERLIQRL
jgi:hypothetical protein